MLPAACLHSASHLPSALEMEEDGGMEGWREGRWQLANVLLKHLARAVGSLLACYFSLSTTTTRWHRAATFPDHWRCPTLVLHSVNHSPVLPPLSSPHPSPQGRGHVSIRATAWQTSARARLMASAGILALFNWTNMTACRCQGWAPRLSEQHSSSSPPISAPFHLPRPSTCGGSRGRLGEIEG